MTFGMKRLFGEDCEVKKELLNMIPKPNKEPISKHTGAGHKITPGPSILGCEPYLICKPCCMEVYKDVFTTEDIPF